MTRIRQYNYRTTAYWPGKSRSSSMCIFVIAVTPDGFFVIFLKNKKCKCWKKMEIFGGPMEIEYFLDWKLVYLEATECFFEGWELELFWILHGITQKSKIIFDTNFPLCNDSHTVCEGFSFWLKLGIITISYRNVIMI